MESGWLGYVPSLQTDWGRHTAQMSTVWWNERRRSWSKQTPLDDVKNYPPAALMKEKISLATVRSHREIVRLSALVKIGDWRRQTAGVDTAPEGVPYPPDCRCCYRQARRARGGGGTTRSATPSQTNSGTWTTQATDDRHAGPGMTQPRRQRNSQWKMR